MTSDDQYWDQGWPLTTGCSKCSPGCDDCWAARLAATRLSRMPQYEGLAGMVCGQANWTGEVRLREHVLELPRRWRKPRRVAVCYLSDLFHPKVPREFLRQALRVMVECDRHIYFVLTKRAKRLRDVVNELVQDRAIGGESATLPDHIRIGVTACNQVEVNEKLGYLRETPAAFRWVSLEPLLGEVHISRHLWQKLVCTCRASRWQDCSCRRSRAIHLVLVGGEAGSRARPMHPQWARNVRDTCIDAGIPFVFKQWGKYWADLKADPHVYGPGEIPLLPDGTDCRGLDSMCDRDLGCVLMRPVGKKKAGRKLDGRVWNEPLNGERQCALGTRLPVEA